MTAKETDSPGQLEDIFRHVTNDRLDDAELLCREALLQNEKDINVLGMLGAILLQKNELVEAEKILQSVNELEPTFARPHEDLGLLYLNQNKPEAAVDCFERATALDASQASAFRGLSTALQQCGRQDEAQATLNKYLALAPTHDSISQARSLHADGESQHAESICEDILKREPENSGALRMLAIIASDNEQHVVAEGLLRRILKLAPDSIAAISELGRFLAERSRLPEAIVLLEQAEKLDASNAQLQLMLGDMYLVVGPTADALRSYEKCLELSPDEPMALLGRGHMLRIIGNGDEAEASYRRCISVNPEIGSAWWSISSLHGYHASDEEVAQIQAQIGAASPSTESEVAFRFALARACERRDDYESAWQQYELANTAKRRLVSYDPVEIEVRHSKMTKVFNAEFCRQLQATDATGRSPIFILGMPRSGSTLIEQILASHSLVEGAGELPYIIMMSAIDKNRPDRTQYPEMVAELDASRLVGLGKSYLYHASTHCSEDRPYFTDKMPANFSHVGFIHSILPNARIIDTRRDPLATCVANYRYLFASGKNQSYDLMELAEYYLQYVQIMDHWNAVLPGVVMRVQYEEVVNDLESQVRKVLDFCGLEFEQDCLEFYKSDRVVNTASSEQVRQPIYKSGVDYHKNYDSHLDVLREILAPIL